ncbi:hypothetical protein GCM10007140_36080 [Priestia taiwanensis]|uniref:histidine kinase n=1 Tax=Priestia taiwanensis TaxID=1347902 RepID=A0A917EU18_9BACI|nr:hypothetical protein GCM10007140_36080 [Priestia taiwanensis]
MRKYMMIIAGALLLVPVTLVPISMSGRISDHPDPYYSSQELITMWHTEATDMHVDNPRQIEGSLHRLKSMYQEAHLFWVNGNGELKLTLPERTDIPNKWSVGYTIEFMKKSYDSDPLTIVAYVGGAAENGFVVLQMPRMYTELPNKKAGENYEYYIIIGSIVVFVSFLLVSWLFFQRIRKRLVRLQGAMELPHDCSIPAPIVISKLDEIGALEESFNKMILTLEESKQNEQEEEQVRRKLIADLSHDLRTPLTAIRAQLYVLKNEVSSVKGMQTIELVDEKIHYLGELLENLLAYTLLTSKKYPYEPTEVDMVKVTRKIIAGWYNKLESEYFDIDVDVSVQEFRWNIDVNWYERMLDNVIQNVIRHGASGEFIGFYIRHDGDEQVITIVDKGPGFEQVTSHKGSGIGLSIIALMAKEMGVTWEIHSTSEGTTFVFKK